METNQVKGVTRSSAHRQASIECYRVVLMFGICLLHCITQGGHQVRGLDNALLSCVDGFVLISGWFGIRPTISKVMFLVSQAACSLLIVSAVNYCIAGNVLSAQEYLLALKNFWFLWAYIVVMAIAPILDVDMKKAKGLLFVVFVWSYLTQIPYVKDYVPRPIGFHAYSFLTLSGIYVCGRVLRKGNILSGVSTAVLIVIALISFCVNWNGFGHYHSISALVFAATTFECFRRLNVVGFLAKAITLASPSMFAVYLIHTNEYSVQWLRNLEDALFGFVGERAYFIFTTIPLHRGVSS